MKIQSSLLLSLLLAATPAFAQIINWDGGPDGTGTDLLTPANWVDDAVPASTGPNAGRQDAQWDGAVAGPLNLTFGAAFGGANGVGLFMTADQTSALTLTNSDVAQQDLRLFTTSAAFPAGVIEIASGAGALTIGAAGTANPIRLLLSAGTLSRNAFFRNNSINTATIEENVLIETGTTGAASSGVIFDTGTWNIKGSLGVFGAGGTGTLSTSAGAFVTLSANNTVFDSRVNVNGGTLSFSALNNLGTSTTSVRLGQTTTSGTLEFTGASDVTIDRLMRVGNGTAGVDTGSGRINNIGAGVLTFNNVTFNEVAGPNNGVNRSLTLGGNNTGNNTISGVIANNNPGLVSLIKADAGTWVLSGANTYTGGTTVSAGTLALGADNTLPDASAVSIAAATLDAATFTDTCGTLDVTAAAATIKLGSGARLVFADSSGITWAGNLNLTGTLDFSGDPTSSLNFGSSAGLTGAQLLAIIANGFTDFALDTEGDLTATPTPTGSAYGSFVSDNGLQDPWLGIDPALNGEPDADPDNDGFPNAVEFVLGEDPTSGTVVNPPTAASVGTNLVFTFRLTDEAASYDPDIWVVESDADLVPAWSVISPGDLEVSVGGDLGGYRLVTVTIPKNGNTNLFARLRVTIP